MIFLIINIVKKPFTLDYGRYNDYNEAEIHNEPDCELSKIFTI